jgi:hypothetical protein
MKATSVQRHRRPSLPGGRQLGQFLLAMLIFAMATPGSAAVATAGAETEPVIVTFETTDGSTFRTVIAKPADIAAVRDALATDGNAGIPSGALAHGDGGVNAPHAWHMEGTTLAEVTIELCDGTAAMVDEDVTYWVETVGQFCPWLATVVAVEPLAPDGDDGNGVSDLPVTGHGTTPVAPASSGLAAAFFAIAVMFGAGTFQLGRASRLRGR